MDFPPNSKKSREEVREAPKRVERVTSGDVTRRRRPLGKQFKSTFFGGDSRSAVDYVIFEIIIPSFKDMIVDAGQNWIERVVRGESSRRRRGAPPSGPMGYMNYRGMSGGGPRYDDRPPMTTRISRQQRARHNFDDIVLSSRSDAEEVLDRLYDVVSQYEVVRVADLYELVGIESRHTDHKWGWADLHGASVERLRNGGYLLDLPEPEPID